MLKISKLTDYAVVLTTRMAALESGSVRPVTDLGRATGIPDPTVRKVLKRLAHHDIVVSQRGAQGGYRLARPPAAICISEVIAAIEGPIAITECASDDASSQCDFEASCEVRGNWQRISAAVQEALEGITLADMAAGEHNLIQLRRARVTRPSFEESQHG